VQEVRFVVEMLSDGPVDPVHQVVLEEIDEHEVAVALEP